MISLIYPSLPSKISLKAYSRDLVTSEHERNVHNVRKSRKSLSSAIASAPLAGQIIEKLKPRNKEDYLFNDGIEESKRKDCSTPLHRTDGL